MDQEELIRAMCLLLLGHRTPDNHKVVQDFLDQTEPVVEEPPTEEEEP